jgi:hydroxymethylpyrimidine pyrophosphatase-like HAD family hydrolase
MPLVAENGAVLVWPSPRMTQPSRIEVLASYKQVEILMQIQEELRNGLIENLTVPVGHEVVLRPNRIATVEIRAQEIATKRGTPNDYHTLIEQIQDLFPVAMPQIDIISSGSSLGIQPKGVSKELGIVGALSRSRINIDDMFFVGMGDNKNDDPLFNFVRQKGGLSIGVRSSAGAMCDFILEGGDEVTLQILKTINSLDINS